MHSAGKVIRFAKNREDSLSRRGSALTARKHVNVVTVALANKKARMAWPIVHVDVKCGPALAASQKNCTCSY